MQLKNSFICKEKAALIAPNIFFQSLGLGGIWQNWAWLRVASMLGDLLAVIWAERVGWRVRLYYTTHRCD